MIVKDLFKLLGQSQWVEIAGNYSGNSPSYAGTIKGLMGETSMNSSVRRKSMGCLLNLKMKFLFL